MMKRSRLPLVLWTAGVLAVVLAAYGWTLGTSRDRLPAVHGRADDYFNLLAHGFLRGHLYLDKPVPRELLALANPYDPAQRPQGLSPHDTSLYAGHYYIYWGPTPVLLVFAPFILLTGQDLPIDYAVLGFVVLGYVLCLAVLYRLRARLFPGAGRCVLLVGAATIGLADFSLVLLRRHSWYELPIACGSSLALAALYCVLRGLDSPRRRWWAAAAGLAVGLAVGARPVYLVAGLLVVLPWCLRRWTWREVAAAAAPCALIGAGLLAYNFARFGNVLEFGVRYQLSGQIESQVRHFALAYAPFNAWAYLFAPLRWGRYFPFFHPILLPAYPPGYGGSDSTFGVLANYPFVWLAAGAVWAIGRRRRPELILVGSLAVAAMIFLLFFVGAIGRYMGDFGPPLLLFAALGACALDDACPRRLRAWLDGLILATALATATVAALTSFSLYDLFAQFAPTQYAALARWANGVVGAVEHFSGGRIAGPVDLELKLQEEPPGTRVPILQTGWAPDTDALVAEYASGRQVSLAYFHGGGDPIAWSPPYPLGGSERHHLHINLGSLYPPVDHPFFLRRGEADEAFLKGWVRARFDGAPEWSIPASFFDSTPGAIAYGPNVISAVRAPAPASVPLAPESWTYQGTVTLQAGWAGRSLPLISTGRTGAGDTLMLRPDGRGAVRFAYDHWNSSLQLSPAVAWPEGTSRRLAFSLPHEGEPLTVQLEGRTVWSVPARAYRTAAYERYPGRNAIGASTCEAAFPGVVFTPTAVSAGDPAR